MADIFRFWNHGAAVIPEYTLEGTSTNNGLYIRHAGWGTQVRQRGGTGNWFHITVPTPSKLDDDTSRHIRGWLDVIVNNTAVITKVHVREGGALLKSINMNYTGQSGIINVDVPNGSVSRPIVFCAYVRFDTNEGQVIFKGAGMEFEEVY